MKVALCEAINMNMYKMPGTQPWAETVSVWAYGYSCTFKHTYMGFPGGAGGKESVC